MDGVNKYRSFVKKNGVHSLNIAAIQKCTKYFFHEKGTIAYQFLPFSCSRVVVIGDPIIDLGHESVVLDSFFSCFTHVSFIQISNKYKILLGKYSYNAHLMGTETCIYIDRFDPTWKTHNYYRRSLSKAKWVTVLECCLKEPATQQLIQSVTSAWGPYLRHKRNYQSLLTQPIKIKHEEGSRCFLAFENNNCIGFKVFYPLYNEGGVIGYVNDVTRIANYAVSGTSIAIFDYAVKAFQEEGASIVKLGLSPFDIDTPKTFLEQLFSNFSRWGGRIYNFSGISEHKKRFHGNVENVYFMSRNSLPFVDLFFILLLILGPPYYCFKPRVFFLSVYIFFTTLLECVLEKSNLFVNSILVMVKSKNFAERWQSGRMRRS